MAVVPIEFGARFDEALKSADKFTSDVTKRLGAIGAFTGFSALKDGIDLAAGAVGGLANFMGEFVDQALEADRGINRLSTALKASGEFSEQNIRTFQLLADELANTTRFTDDAVIASVTLAKQFNVTNQEADKLVRAATNLAEATGVGLEEAVRQLGQTLDGTAGRLAQTIPELQLLTKEQLRAGAAVDVVSGKFKDFAQNALGGFDGQMIQAKKAFGELQEDIGTFIIKNEAVVNVLTAVTEGLNVLRQVVKDNADVITRGLTAAVVFLVDAFSATVDAIRYLDLAFSSVYLVIQATFELFRQLGNYLVERFSGIIKGVQLALSRDFVGAAEAFKGAVVGAFTDPVQLATESTRRLQETVDGFNSRERVYDGLIDGATKFHLTVESGNTSLARQDSVQRGLASGYDNAVNKNKLLLEAQRKQAEALEKQKKEFEKIKTSVADLEKSLKDAGKTDIEIIRDNYKERVLLLDQALKQGAISQAKYVHLEALARVQAEDKLFDLKRKNIAEAAKLQREVDEDRQRKYESFVARIREIIQDPVKGFFVKKDENGNLVGNSLGLSETGQEAVAGGLGITNQILGGAGGAKKLLGSIGSAIGIAFLGPAGEALGPIIEQLSAGPEEVKKMVKGFAEALPILVENLILAVPELIASLAEQFPIIIDRLIDRLPEIIEALIRALPRVIGALVLLMPRVVIALVAGAGRFVGKILQGAARFIGEIIKGAGRFISAIIKGIGKAVTGGGKGLLGGRVIRGILKTDTQSPAQQTGQPLRNTQRAPASGDHKVQVQLQLGQKQLATAVVDLKRMGYRLDPSYG